MMDTLSQYHEHLLSRAMQCWRRGEPIPLTVAVELAGEGFDVGALEDQFMHEPFETDYPEDSQ